MLLWYYPVRWKGVRPYKTARSPAGRVDYRCRYSRSRVVALEIGQSWDLDMLQDGAVLGIKYTGAGKSVVDGLTDGADPPKAFTKALEETTRLAIAQNRKILIDAEQDEFQKTIN
ncbi:hypothetical protein K469DRAFT_688124 [Zopfia rhizophila CBS 207.26]|uniref:Uncharacterized protein n=1 Tax=Zopfia rhizophila CBS 207.26 TaxID=1314779 RepID=A0A6A6E072_9PEZI|nr:hypothetical protein K469DRAFT_688124 [Zopfia rhizophila CBS 207.26]